MSRQEDITHPSHRSDVQDGLNVDGFGERNRSQNANAAAADGYTSGPQPTPPVSRITSTGNSGSTAKSEHEIDAAFGRENRSNRRDRADGDERADTGFANRTQGAFPQQGGHDYPQTHKGAKQTSQQFSSPIDVNGVQESEHELMNHISSLEAAKEDLEKLIEEEIRKRNEERESRFMLERENLRLKKKVEKLEASKSSEQAIADLKDRVENLAAEVLEYEAKIKQEKEGKEHEKKQKLAFEMENSELKRRCDELEAKADTAKGDVAEDRQASLPPAGSTDAGTAQASSREIELKNQVRELTSEVATYKKLSEEYKAKWKQMEEEYKKAETAIREWKEMGDLTLLQRFLKEKNIFNNIGSTDCVHEERRNSRLEQQHQQRYLKSVNNVHSQQMSERHDRQHQQHISQPSAQTESLQEEKREISEQLDKAQRRAKDLQAQAALLQAERDQALRELAGAKESLKQTKKRLVETKRLAEERKHEQNTLEATLLKTQTDLKQNFEARKESEYAVSRLKSDVEVLQRDLGSATIAKERAAGQRDVALEERSKLFRLLQGATVKRTDAPKSTDTDGFPTGGQIERFATKVRDGAADLFHGIHDILMEAPVYNGPKEVTESYQITLDNVMYSSWSAAVAWVEVYERNKLEELSFFLNQMPVDELFQKVETDNTLLHLFWVYSMQEVVRYFPKTRDEFVKGLSSFLHDREMARQQEADGGVATEGGAAGSAGDDVYMEDAEEQDGSASTKTAPTNQEEDPSLHFVQWVRQAEVCQALEELEVPSWDSFTIDCVLLLLFCKFSDPPCHLWPPVGTSVQFHSDYFKVEALPSGPRKPKNGDSVRVLFPGLYYVNPRQETEDGSPVEPKMKAIVVSFPRKLTE